MSQPVIDAWAPDLLICRRCGQDVTLVRHYVNYCDACGGGREDEWPYAVARCTPEFEHRPWCPVKGKE